MLKIIHPTNNKGFTYSPFILIFLVIFSLELSFHFMETEKLQVEGIHKEGQINRVILDMEEMKLNMNTVALFSSYNTISAKKNKTITELEKEIEEKMNKYIRHYNPFEISTLEGNFSIRIEKLPNNHLLLKTHNAPRACINRSGINLCSNLSIERIIEEKK